MIILFPAYKALGVFGINVTSGNRYHDTTGLAQKGGNSEYQILTPVLQIGDMANNAAAVMFNLHSERRRAKAIDYTLDCVRALEKANEERFTADVSHNAHFHQFVASNCTSITEVVFLVQDPPGTRPASLTLFPILAYDDSNKTLSIKTDKKTVPSEVVGFVSAVHNWDTVLNIATNDKVTGIMAVLSNGIDSHSFMFDNGVVKYLGKGDLHESDFDTQRYVFDVTHPNDGFSLLTSTPLTYTLTLYPTKVWIDLYSNSIPAIVCGVAVGLVVFTSIIFSLYDYLINRNVNEKENILHAKRQFVRYISHEIRTPMNVVFLGFQLLCTEMLNFPHLRILQEQLSEVGRGTQDDTDNRSSSSVSERFARFTDIAKTVLQKQQDCYTDQFKDWLDLIQDIIQSADAAITVLNDLMSYDKLDTGTMVIERELLPIWEIIDSTVHPFTVQAKAKNIELEIITKEIHPAAFEDSPIINDDSVRGTSFKRSGRYSPKTSFRIVPVSSASEVDCAGGDDTISAFADTSDTLMRSSQSNRLRESLIILKPISLDFDAISNSQRKSPNAFLSTNLDIESANHTLKNVSPIGNEVQEEIVFAFSDQFVLGDKAKISQVVRNLVSNALKFTPAGGKVTIRASWKPHGLGDAFTHLTNDLTRATAKDKDNKKSEEAIDLHQYIGCGSLVLSVTDTGAGMSAENLSRLFQEGVQFNAGKLQAGQGSGLGLWISKGIVELHRGKLSADSKGEGTGSTFTLELPVLLSRKKPNTVDSTALSTNVGVVSSQDAAKSVGPIIPPTKFGGVDLISSFSPLIMRRFSHILVVDDSEIIRKMVCRSLKSLGFTCQQAVDGQQCVEIMLKIKNEGVRAASGQDHPNGIDLILMDYEMPRMIGPLAVTRLRELGIKTPVIGVTGNVLKEDSEYYIQCGANKVIHKPFTVKTLERVLQELTLAHQSSIKHIDKSISNIYQ